MSKQLLSEIMTRLRANNGNYPRITSPRFDFPTRTLRSIKTQIETMDSSVALPPGSLWSSRIREVRDGRGVKDHKAISFLGDTSAWVEVGIDALPVATSVHSSLVYDGKMWVIGGWNDTSKTRKVYWSTDGLTWTEAGSNALPVATYAHTSLVFAGKMWVIGGENTSGTAVRKVYYSTDGATWTEAGTNALPVALRNHQSVVYNGKMWVIGGRTTSTNLQTVYYSTDGINWTEAGTNSFPVGTIYAGTCVYDGKMWMLGGYTTGYVRKVYYSTDGITWTEAGSNALPTNSRRVGVVVYNGAMYILGATTTSKKVLSSTTGATWTEVGTDIGPSGLNAHTLLLYRGRFFAIGGQVSSVSSRKVYCSQYDPTLLSSYDLSATGGYRQVIDGWYQDNIPAAQSATAALRLSGASDNTLILPRGGSVTGIAVYSNAPCTAGALLAEVYFNGSPTGLQAYINTTDQTFKVTTQAKDTNWFVAGDKIDIRFSTSADFAPNGSADIRAVLEIET